VPSPTLLTSIEGSRFEGLEEPPGASKSSNKQDKVSGGSGKRKYRRHPKVRFFMFGLQQEFVCASIGVLMLLSRERCNTRRKRLTSHLPHQPDDNAPERPPSAYVIFSNSKGTPPRMFDYHKLTCE